MLTTELPGEEPSLPYCANCGTLRAFNQVADSEAEEPRSSPLPVLNDDSTTALTAASTTPVSLPSSDPFQNTPRWKFAAFCTHCGQPQPPLLAVGMPTMTSHSSQGDPALQQHVRLSTATNDDPNSVASAVNIPPTPVSHNVSAKPRGNAGSSSLSEAQNSDASRIQLLENELREARRVIAQHEATIAESTQKIRWLESMLEGQGAAAREEAQKAAERTYRAVREVEQRNEAASEAEVAQMLQKLRDVMFAFPIDQVGK